jgi:hypothetical protein
MSPFTHPNDEKTPEELAVIAARKKAAMELIMKMDAQSKPKHKPSSKSSATSKSPTKPDTRTPEQIQYARDKMARARAGRVPSLSPEQRKIKRNQDLRDKRAAAREDGGGNNGNNGNGVNNGKPSPLHADPNDSPNTPDTMDSNGLLGDLMWIYRKWGGKEKLLEKIEMDKDIQKAFVRELLALEKRAVDTRAKLEDAGSKGKAGGMKKAVFTIKGLYPTKSMEMKVTPGKVDDPDDETDETDETEAEVPRMSMESVPPEMLSVTETGNVENEGDDEWI